MDYVKTYEYNISGYKRLETIYLFVINYNTEQNISKCLRNNIEISNIMD